MAEKISKVSLDELLELKEKGNRLYKTKEFSEPFEDKDIKIKAIVNSKNKIYIYEDEFWFYGYERDDTIRFDSDDHPYWNAYFGQNPQNSFRLYDGYFLGRYGCGGSHRYLEIIKEVYNLISASKSKRHKKVLDEFDSFYNSIHDNKIYKLKKEFGLIKREKQKKIKVIGLKQRKIDPDIVARALGAERFIPIHGGEEKKFLLFTFGGWYGQFINKNGEYDRKIKGVRKKEHEAAFKEYIQEIIKKLESRGFKRTIQQPSNNNWVNSHKSSKI